MPRARAVNTTDDDEDVKPVQASATDEDEAIGPGELDEAVPFEVEDLDVGDLSEQEGGVLPAASRVIGEIKKASIKTNLLDNKRSQDPDDNPWTFKSLHLEIAIGALGTDGEGTYKGKVLFCDLILVYDAAACKRSSEAKSKKFNAQWWEKESRYPAKQFIKALGGDVKNVRVNDDFLLALIGREVMFDIKKVKDSFRGEGEFRNELANWRAVETGDDE